MSKSISHIPHLDSLRAIAAFIVVFEHFFKDWAIAHLGIGRYGVDIFFTISGFLITSILLRQRNEALGVSKLTLAKNFFVRRALRLFPVYYLLLFALLLLSIATGVWIGDRQDLVYYFTYTPNILFYLKDYQSPLLNHTWSLGIEEQFYLVWPWLILFVPQKAVQYLIYFSLFVGFFSRWFLNSLIPSVGDVNFLPFGNFHTLGIGALLAYWVVNNSTRVLEALKKWNVFIIILSIGSFILVYPFRYKYLYLHDVFLALATMSLVYQAFIGYKGIAGLLFDMKWLKYLGKISYGIYLYHKVIPLFVKLPLSKFNITLPPFAGFLISVLITVVIAHLSWIIIEKPILKLKERFDS